MTHPEEQADTEPHSVTEVIGELDELASHSDTVCVADVLDDFGKRSFGPFIMIPALLELSPVGAIPGIPTMLASFIALIAVQLLIGREHIWLPGFVQHRSLKAKTLHKAVSKLRGTANWLDDHSKDRLDHFAKGIWVKVAAVAVIVLCATVPFLEVLPFASSAPMLAIAAIGLALIVRDGLVMVLAFALAAAALAGGTYFYSSSDEGEDEPSEQTE